MTKVKNSRRIIIGKLKSANVLLQWFSGGDAEPSDKQKKKKKYVCPLSFKEQIELMRGLHPDKECTDPCQELDPSLKTWRRSCATALKVPDHFEPVDFGGYFKEAIRVSTFSNRNYSLVEQIIEQAAGEKAIFRESCGFKDEVVLNQLLGEMVTNQIQKSEFNKTLKDLKKQLIPRDHTDGDTAIRQQLKVAQAKVKALERELDVLKAENVLLRAQVEEKSRHESERRHEDQPREDQPRDVFDFAEDEERSMQEDINPGCDIPITVEVWEPEVQTGLEDCLQVKLPWNSKKKLSASQINNLLEDSDINDDDSQDPDWSKQKDKSFSSVYGSDDDDDDDALDILNRGFLQPVNKPNQDLQATAKKAGTTAKKTDATAKDMKMAFYRPTQKWLPVAIRGTVRHGYQVTFILSGLKTVVTKSFVREPTKAEKVRYRL